MSDVLQSYYICTAENLADYLKTIPVLVQKLGDDPSNWDIQEVGDGNLNLVFIVKTLQATVCVKQALPYVRMVGEGWSLPLIRSHFEHLALSEQYKIVPEYVPQIHHYDPDMALMVMTYLEPHIILRKGLIAGKKYPVMAKDLAKFLAKTFYYTSDFALDSVTKKQKIADYLPNTAMCQISENLIFDEPYYDAPLNRHTSPQLDDIVADFKKDAVLVMHTQNMKYRFLNAPEALIHGDIHTGSVMVTQDQTYVIDPEFAFYGPVGFDIGMLWANFFMAYFAGTGHRHNEDYGDWILEQIKILWIHFKLEFYDLVVQNRMAGDVCRSYISIPSVILACTIKLRDIWSDALGFAGCEIIRRIMGLAHVEDFESIADVDKRSLCERQALLFARALLVERETLKTVTSLFVLAKKYKL